MHIQPTLLTCETGCTGLIVVGYNIDCAAYLDSHYVQQPGPGQPLLVSVRRLLYESVFEVIDAGMHA